MTVKHKTDVAIIGGGIAGTAAAILLGRKNIPNILIDPREEFRKEFRCEKFNDTQVESIRRMGLADDIFPEITPINDVWVVRYGHLVNKAVYPHFGFSYETAVNALRKSLSAPTRFLVDRIRHVENSPHRQRLTLTNGDEIEARLVILANGLNPALQQQLGLRRKMLSAAHCMAIGFDVTPLEGRSFPFDSITYWPESPLSKMAYFTIFKNGDGYRANMFGYWAKDSRAMAELRVKPQDTLTQLMPRLLKTTGRFGVEGRVHIRPIDLHVLENAPLDGVIAVGDAYSTSCPGAGTGTGKALIDVEQLCGSYIPDWLEKDRINSTLINAFYHDSGKTENDSFSLNEAYFLRSISLERTPKWALRRFLRFGYHWLKGARHGVPFEPFFNPECRRQIG